MGQFPEMFRLAKILEKNSLFNPIIYFNLGAGGDPNVIRSLESGIDILDYYYGYVQGFGAAMRTQSAVEVIHEKELKTQVESTPAPSLKQKVKQNFPRLFYATKKIVHAIYKNLHLLGFVHRVTVKLKRSRKERKLLKLFDIKLMIFAEDSEAYHTPQLIKSGHDFNIKSVVFPYTFANQYEFLEDAFFHDLRVNKSISNFLVGSFFPKWTQKYKGKRLLKSSPALIFASEFFKGSPPNPWVMSSGFADVIAVESQYMKEYYRNAGIPEDQMVETGSPSLDNLYEIIKNRDLYRTKLAAKLGLDVKKSWVVCAIPPSQWPRAGVGFKSYKQFLKAFITFLKSFDGVELIFKIHPRLEVAEAKRYCKEFGIAFIHDDTSDLIAVSDMYVASASSTMRWSLAMGIPTINYDLYDYNYGDFACADNYHVTVKFEEFQSVYTKLYEQLVEKEKSSYLMQERFAVLDGQSQRRIMDLFTFLVPEI